MVNVTVAPLKCLFHVATHIEKSIYSNRAISTFDLVENWPFLTPHSYINS